MRTGVGAARFEALSAGADNDPQIRPEGCGPCHSLGRRPGRQGRDPRLVDAVGVSSQFLVTPSAVTVPPVRGGRRAAALPWLGLAWAFLAPATAWGAARHR